MLEVEPQLIEQYVQTGVLRIVVRPLLQTGPDALVAAHGAECAAEQNQFFAMRSAIYDQQGTLFMAEDKPAALADIAVTLGMAREPFAACMTSERYNQALYQGYTRATSDGITNRPVFDVNGTRLIGSQSIDVFERVISALVP